MRITQLLKIIVLCSPKTISLFLKSLAAIKKKWNLGNDSYTGVQNLHKYFLSLLASNHQGDMTSEYRDNNLYLKDD